MVRFSPSMYVDCKGDRLKHGSELLGNLMNVVDIPGMTQNYVRE